jgi:hypothetical protein
MIIKQGIVGIIEFCKEMQERNIHFGINMYSSDAITVTITLVGARIEVEFQKDVTTYSVFHGDESVEAELNLLSQMIKSHV